jgi:hypothetical protein
MIGFQRQKQAEKAGLHLPVLLVFVITWVVSKKTETNI